MPQWIVGATPGPEPEPKEPVFLRTPEVITTPKFRTQQGQVIEPEEGWDATARTLTNWGVMPSERQMMGVSDGNKNMEQKFDLRFDLTDVLGVACSFSWYGLVDSGRDDPRFEVGWDATLTIEEPTIQIVRGESSHRQNASPGAMGANGEFTILCNRPSYEDVLVRITLSAFYGNTTKSNVELTVNKWWAEDAGAYALRNQIAMQQKLERLTQLRQDMDIDFAK